MKVWLDTKEDVRLLNWNALCEQIIGQMRDKLVSALNAAADAVKDLEPGETKRFSINVGEIEISREASNE